MNTGRSDRRPMESMILDSSKWVYRPSLRRWESISASEARNPHCQLLPGHL